jgi:hypothetical protein
VARADTHTQLEAEAYCAWLDAGYALERDRLTDALRQYTRAKYVYSTSPYHTIPIIDSLFPHLYRHRYIAHGICVTHEKVND